MDEKKLVKISQDEEIKIVENYLSQLSDEELFQYPILPKCKHCMRLEFDTYKIFKYGFTLKSIVEKLSIFKDCNFLYSPAKEGIIDIFFDFSEDISQDEYDECIYTFKNVILSFEISGIIGISSIYPRLENGSYILDTDGSNLICVLSLLGIDQTRTVTNSLWEIRTLFGIEATRQFLINQVLKIMSANGIYVHKKYIQLLADSMTYTGIYLPANRHGMSRKICGTFSKSSYEETLRNFVIAAIDGEKDELKGISARVILGLCGYIGSNYLKSKVIEREEFAPSIPETEEKKTIIDF